MGERGNPLLKRLDYIAGIPATFPAALFRKLDRCKKISGHSPQRIGIICLGAMGDLLLLSALADGIHKKAPHCAIELIVSRANSQAVPLLPHVTTHFSAPVSNIAKFVKWLRQRHYDILFDSSQWARIGSVLCSLSSAALTVGFSTKGQWRAAGYDMIVPHSPNQHEVDNFVALGAAVWPDFKGKPALNIGARQPNGHSVSYCHMHPAPGRGRHLKEWPQEHWAELISILAGRGHKIFLTGSEADAAANEAFLAKYFVKANYVKSIAGQLSLHDLAAHLACATSVISVNTGIMHLASLAGAPTVGLHGATNPRRWGPVGPRSVSLVPDKGQFGYLNLGFEYPKNAVSAMSWLPVGKVLEALEQLADS